MANTRGVFTLQDVRYAQEDEVWVSPDQAFASNLAVPPNIGYSGGGQGPSVGDISSFAKTNFTDDTSSNVPSANLIANTTNTKGLGNPSNGYIMGGGLPVVSTTNKLSYASETVSAAPGSAMSAGRYSHGTLGRQEFAGYVVGGGNPNYLYPKSDTQKLIYAVDTFHLLPAAFMTAAGMQVTGASNTTQGIFGTGASPAGPGLDSAFNKLTYSSETTELVPGVNTIAKSRVSANGNDTHGYFAGGEIPSGTLILSTITKYTYSTDTIEDLTDKLTIPKQNAGASGNSAFGYVIAGLNKDTAPTTFYSSVDKINFTTDGVARAPGANLPSPPRGAHGSICGRGNGQNETKKSFAQSTQNLKGQPTFNFGYFMGGEPGPGPHSYAQKLDYSTETVGHVNPANLSIARSQGGQTQNKTHGFYGGGFNPPVYYSTMDKTTFASDTTVAVPGGALTAGRGYVTAAGNQNFGYFAGGSSPSPVYTGYDKMSYASDTTAQLPSVFMSSPKGNAGSAAGNQSRGYYGGGNPGPNSIIDKLTYSTETSSRVTTADLSISNYNRGATGNADKGYWAGGVPSVSTVEVLDYSTETRAVLPEAPLTQARYSIGATGNSQSGYFGGGTNGTPEYSIVDKINYSTNTIARVPQGDLLEAAWGQGGFSSLANGLPQSRPETPTLNQSLSTSGIPNFGYIAGGSGPGSTQPLSSIDKYNFDTDTRLPFTGQLSIARYIGASGSSSTAGYVAMGLSYVAPTYYRHSRVDKLTFATENVAPVPGANTVLSLQNSCGASSSLAAYFSGGAPGPVSTTQKMTFSAETTAAVPGAALSSNRDATRAASSSVAMYISGGNNPPAVSTVEKLIFSTDTTSPIPSGALNAARYVGGMVGNATQGYYGGGYTGSAGLSSINKVNYSTDTTQLAGNLSRTSWNIGATGNATKGYFVAGVPGPLSTVDKIDYVTETTSVIQSLSGTRYGVIGVSGRCNAGAYTSNVL